MPAPACYPAVLATYNAANNAACATMPATMQVATTTMPPLVTMPSANTVTTGGRNPATMPTR